MVNYLRVIYRLLAPGGVWINLGMTFVVRLHATRQANQLLGPLLWHFENNTNNDMSIELDLDELKTLARGIGFDIKVLRLS